MVQPSTLFSSYFSVIKYACNIKKISKGDTASPQLTVPINMFHPIIKAIDF